MRPAEHQVHGVAFGQRLVAVIAIDLQDAGEAIEVSNGPLAFAIRRVAIGDGRGIGAAPGPVVSGIGEELAGLCPAAAGIEYRYFGLVGEQLGGGLQHRQQPFMLGPQQEGRPSDQSASVERSSAMPFRA